jgi:UDPglucose 6-dehydrogenase
MATARAELGEEVTMCEDGYQALDGADALVVFTDWPQFRTPDFEIITAKLRQRVLFDGRNLYDPRSLAKKGFQYFCIGRPAIAPSQ